MRLATLVGKCILQESAAVNGIVCHGRRASAGRWRLSASLPAESCASRAQIRKCLSKNDTGVISLPARHRWR